MKNRQKITDRRAVLGILLVLVGSLILFQNVGIVTSRINDYIFSWQMLLIVVGLFNLSHRRHNVFGLILISLGVAFMIPKAFDISIDFSHVFWPIVLVGFGILILFKRHREPDWEECKSKMHEKFHTHQYTRPFNNPFCGEGEAFDKDKNYNSSDAVNDFNFFSGCERVMNTKKFAGGRITSVFGGSSYDLLDCELADGENVLDVVHIFGGVKLLVPSDWKVYVEVVTIFGGYSDKRRSVVNNPENPSKVLFIRGIAIFGGGEIKNI